MGILLYIERAGTISSKVENLIFALELLENQFKIDEEFFEEYLFLVLDLRTLIVLEMLNDESANPNDLKEFFTTPLSGNEIFQASQRHQDFFSQILKEQSEAVNGS